MAVSNKIQSFRIKDLEFITEPVWAVILMKDGCNLLIGNHYFSSDIRPEMMATYFNRLSMKWILRGTEL